MLFSWVSLKKRKERKEKNFASVTHPPKHFDWQGHIKWLCRHMTAQLITKRHSLVFDPELYEFLSQPGCYKTEGKGHQVSPRGSGGACRNSRHSLALRINRPVVSSQQPLKAYLSLSPPLWPGLPRGFSPDCGLFPSALFGC